MPFTTWRQQLGRKEGQKIESYLHRHLSSRETQIAWLPATRKRSKSISALKQHLSRAGLIKDNPKVIFDRKDNKSPYTIGGKSGDKGWSDSRPHEKDRLDAHCPEPREAYTIPMAVFESMCVSWEGGAGFGHYDEIPYTRSISTILIRRWMGKKRWNPTLIKINREGCIYTMIRKGHCQLLKALRGDGYNRVEALEIAQRIDRRILDEAQA